MARRCYKGDAAWKIAEFVFHAKATSPSIRGFHFMTASSVIFSWPVSMAEIASAFIMRNIRAVIPSLAKRICLVVFGRQDTLFVHWLVAQDGKNQFFKCLVRGPARQCDYVEPARQLHVALNSLALP